MLRNPHCGVLKSEIQRVAGGMLLTLNCMNAHALNGNTLGSLVSMPYLSWPPRKNFHVDDKSCVLCHDETSKSRTQLFFGCEFSQIFWWKLNQEWNMDLDIIDMLIDGRNRFNQKCFKEYLIIGCWSLWNHRNKIIFDGGHLSLDSCFSFFKETFSLIRHRAKPSLNDGMQQWLDTL